MSKFRREFSLVASRLLFGPAIGVHVGVVGARVIYPITFSHYFSSTERTFPDLTARMLCGCSYCRHKGEVAPNGGGCAAGEGFCPAEQTE